MKDKRIAFYEDASLTSDDVKRLKEGIVRDAIDVISLRNCNVTDKDYKLILKTLGASRVVRHLSLCVDQVTDKFRVQVLAKALQKNISLAGLHLHGNPVTDEYICTLQQPIYRHPRLVCLDLSDCRLGDQGVAILTHILKDTRERHGLQELLLGHNTSITGEGWRRLAMSLAAGSTLHTLHIDHNVIGDVSAGCLVTALPGATRLSTLDMECTGITDVTGQVLLNLIKSFKLNLKTIVLKNNKIAQTTKAEIKLKLNESDNHELINMFAHNDLASDDSRSLATSEPPLEAVTGGEYHDYAIMSRPQSACLSGQQGRRFSRPECNEPTFKATINQPRDTVFVQAPNEITPLAGVSKPLTLQSASDSLSGQHHLLGVELTQTASSIQKESPMTQESCIQDQHAASNQNIQDNSVIIDQTTGRPTLSAEQINCQHVSVNEPDKTSNAVPTEVNNGTHAYEFPIKNERRSSTSQHSGRNVERQSHIDATADDSSSDFSIGDNDIAGRKSETAIPTNTVRENVKTKKTADKLANIYETEPTDNKANVSSATKAAVRARILEVASVIKKTETETADTGAISVNKEPSSVPTKAVNPPTPSESNVISAQALNGMAPVVIGKQNEAVNVANERVSTTSGGVKCLSKPIPFSAKPTTNIDIQLTQKQYGAVTTASNKQAVPAQPVKTPQDVISSEKQMTNKNGNKWPSSIPLKRNDQILPKPRLVSPKSADSIETSEHRKNSDIKENVSKSEILNTQSLPRQEGIQFETTLRKSEVVANKPVTSSAPIKVQTMSGPNEFSVEFTTEKQHENVVLTQPKAQVNTSSNQLITPERPSSANTSAENRAISGTTLGAKPEPDGNNKGDVPQKQKSISGRRRNRKTNAGGDLASAIKNRQAQQNVEKTVDNKPPSVEMALEEL